MGPNEKRALREEAEALMKESERLKSNIERSKREIDALREQNARLSRTLARYQREGLELKREERRVTLRREEEEEEERRETEYAEVLRDAFRHESPRKWGERESIASSEASLSRDGRRVRSRHRRSVKEERT